MGSSPNKGKGKGIGLLRSLIGHKGAACVVWPFSIGPNGYGRMGYLGVMNYPHRIMCRLAHGEPPTPTHEAAHSCGNRLCINPHHLSWKTPAGNQFDRRLHGTTQRGRKLNKHQWAEIRALKGKMTQRKIAEMYGVTFQNVSALHRKSVK